jgi:hypothetical protein
LPNAAVKPSLAARAMRDLSISDSCLDPLSDRGWIQLTVHTWFADAPLVDGDQWQS